jgi:hypothetical protein
MVYVPTIWHENAMTQTQKINGLNNLETQAAEGISYIDAFLHDSTYFTQAFATSTFFRTANHPSGRNDGPGSLINAAQVDGYSLTQLQALAIPSGAIALWAKSVASIPTRWLFCNGLNQTPDFRGRILVGAGNGYTPGSTGGGGSVTPSCSAFDSDSVALTTNQIPKHTHSVYDYYNPIVDAAELPGGRIYANSKTHNVTTSGINGIPNAGCSTHGHTGNTFAFTGYYDDDNVFHAGSIPIVPKSKALAYILRR